jgi:Polyphosphate kinase 2 (PPK2)
MPQDMKPEDFVAVGRPRLADITRHPVMGFADYERRLTSLQGVLQLIQQAYLATGDRALIVLEGWDTAGKGGIVRRLGWALDPRSFKVHSIAAPDEHERAQHYLQRFWHRLPAMVRPGSGRTRRRHRNQKGMAARLPRDQRIRADADQFRGAPRQAIPAHHAG